MTSPEPIRQFRFSDRARYASQNVIILLVVMLGYMVLRQLWATRTTAETFIWVAPFFLVLLWSVLEHRKLVGNAAALFDNYLLLNSTFRHWARSAQIPYAQIHRLERLPDQRIKILYAKAKRQRTVTFPPEHLEDGEELVRLLREKTGLEVKTISPRWYHYQPPKGFHSAAAGPGGWKAYLAAFLPMLLLPWLFVYIMKEHFAGLLLAVDGGTLAALTFLPALATTVFVIYFWPTKH